MGDPGTTSVQTITTLQRERNPLRILGLLSLCGQASVGFFPGLLDLIFSALETEAGLIARTTTCQMTSASMIMLFDVGDCGLSQLHHSLGREYIRCTSSALGSLLQ